LNATNTSIPGLIVTPKLSAGLIQGDGLQVCEIRNHGFKDSNFELDKLHKLLETHRVEVTPAIGKLVRQKKRFAEVQKKLPAQSAGARCEGCENPGL
jgi:hypothetical protein